MYQFDVRTAFPSGLVRSYLDVLLPFYYPLKPGLHIVVIIADYACDHISNKILKLSTHRLQMFLVKYEQLPLLQLCKGQGICEKL